MFSFSIAWCLLPRNLETQSVRLLHHLLSFALEVTLKELLKAKVAQRFARPFIPLAQRLSCQLLPRPAILQIYPLSLARQALPFGRQPRHLFS